MMIPYEVVRFASIECKLQQSGEISVLWMVDAWKYAFERSAYTKQPTVDDILTIARLVEPNENHNGFRKYGVRVGRDVYEDWWNVPIQMMNLVADYNEGGMTPEEYFKRYEQTHGFGDGNGRSGALLYLWIKDCLVDPVWPPNFWNDPRRTIGYGA